MLGKLKYSPQLSIQGIDILAGVLKGAGAAAPTFLKGLGLGTITRTSAGLYTVQLGQISPGIRYGKDILCLFAQAHPASNAGLTYAKVDPVPSSTGLLTIRWFVQSLVVSGSLTTPTPTDMTTGDFLDLMAVVTDSEGGVGPRVA